MHHIDIGMSDEPFVKSIGTIGLRQGRIRIVQQVRAERERD